MNPSSANLKREPSDDSPRVYHTLTACCRCRTRKTRCDPGLPRCGPCERTNSHCDYYDPNKGIKIPRNYVVHLQHKVCNLERQLAELEKDDQEPDPESVVRGEIAVRLQESDETKYLGPSSGTPLTRLVMQLAKQFTDSKSISDIVPDSRAQMIKETFVREELKPTSKVYPLISDVAADELPTKELTKSLIQLFFLKVHPMYPLFHEPSFHKDVEDVYEGSTNPFQNFALRMVIAVSLQKMDTQYAGLADSYYLAALKYLSDAIRPMDIRTLQCFALIAGYSLLTPTRTAVYYIIGLAVRLCESLGYNKERTIVLGKGGKMADPLEIDMRRRLFWSIVVMDFGLAHSLGRPSSLATGKDHIDVKFFELVDDEFITRECILPASQPSLKKWISIHFFKMRLLQLEIRRKLYQKKRPEPKNDGDLWFQEMERKLIEWRDTSPEIDGGSGLTKTWFIGRFNTMRVFLFRPSPQVPRPSVRAAIQCYDACKFNIHMHRRQIATGSVDLTWIFTQSIFMAINTLLWSLSYSEVRRQHPREEVEGHLNTSLEAIQLASERWPGVLSALELYRNLIDACMKIYDKDGDVPIAPRSPSDSVSVSGSTIAENMNGSRTTSPATVSTQSIATPSERNQPSHGYFNAQQAHAMQVSPPPSVSSQYQLSPAPSAIPYPGSRSPATPTAQAYADPLSKIPISNSTTNPSAFDPSSQYNPLPSTFPDLVNWSPSFSLPQVEPYTLPPVSEALQSPINFSGPSQQQQFGIVQSNSFPIADYLYEQSWGMDRPGMGLTQEQQTELMHSLETSGTGQIENMIQQSSAIFGQQVRSF